MSVTSACEQLELLDCRGRGERNQETLVMQSSWWSFVDINYFVAISIYLQPLKSLM